MDAPVESAYLLGPRVGRQNHVKLFDFVSLATAEYLLRLDWLALWR
jgi:hypothetical protein